MPGLGLTARYIAALAGAVLFAGLLGVMLWAHDHAARRDAALNAHVQLVLRDLTEALEARLAIGLPLAQLPEVDRLLDAARLQLPLARAVAVLDEQGRGLFSTDPVEVGDGLLDAGAMRNADGKGNGGRRSGGADDIFWLPIASDDGAVAGAALLRLPAGTAHDGVTAFALSLTVRAAPALAALVGLAALMGYWLAVRAGRPALAAAGALAALGRQPTADADADAPSVVAGLPLAAFAAAVSARHRRLAAVEEELGRLDETA